MDWLQEFPAQVDLNKIRNLKSISRCEKEGGYFLPRIAWDMVPGYWTEHEAYMDKNTWRETEVAKNSDLVEVYDHVIEEFDRFLAEHGYVREGAHYRVEKESDETVTFSAISESAACCCPIYGMYHHLCFGIVWLLHRLL